MGLKDDLTTWTRDVFRSAWTKRDGTKVPDDDSKLGLKNDAIEITGTVLYADLADSTKMVDNETSEFAAEVYKTFLYCAGQVIRDAGGTITAYDGDRIMAVFMGSTPNTDAVRAAMKIRWATDEIVRPQLRDMYKHKSDFTIPHVIGVDTSKLFVAKTGVRGANDLVWVGRAANYAAKLSSLPSTYIYITKDVYDKMTKDTKFSGETNMWTLVKWNTFDNSNIYRSSYRWSID